MLLSAYAGKILRVNLTSGKVKTIPLSSNLVENYVGGKGLGARLLYDEVKRGIDPLGPDNKLIFATGPASGTIVPTKGYILTFKSPLTNIYASCSSGGFVAAELKWAGYDALIIEGRAEKPVYLWIDDQHIEIRDAKHIWGKDTIETYEMIIEELGDHNIKVIRIGPAGENLVKIAAVFNAFSRTAARGGPGAVMGSKNLKAIAVRGSKNIEVNDMDGLIEFVKDFYKTIKASPGPGERYPKYGTMPGLKERNFWGILPTKNWQEGVFGVDTILADPEAIRSKIVFKNKACHSCVVNCGKLSVLKEGKYKGVAVEGPEYETLFALGSLCYNSNLESIAKLNDMCDRLGLDTISTGSVIAFAMECYERGLITKKDTDGIELTWGNDEAMIQLVNKIAMKEGFGNILSEGVREAAKQLGKDSEEFAIHVKGLELASLDPRGLKGMALQFAIADRGGCHLPATIYKDECSGKIDRFAIEGKAEYLKNLTELLAFTDTLILCRFYRGTYTAESLAQLMLLLTGAKMTENDLQLIGERIVTTIRAFNVREGIRKKDDTLPKRFFKEVMPEGASKDLLLNEDEFNQMRDEFYDLMGWDQDGIPTREQLVKVGLSDLISDMTALREEAE
ncbi:MAG: aldehyde ferredoxin oxidoreductase family protein [Promethearchaeota archaeon]